MPRDGLQTEENANQNDEDFTLADAPPESDEAAVIRLAVLSIFDYERVRTDEAEKLKIRAPILDKLVEAERRQAGANGKPLQGRALTIEAPEPWPEPVDGANLLDDLATFFARHATLPAHGAHSLALWALHTHCYSAARHTPRLAITSTEKGCGKTTILDLLELTCCRPLPAANLTAAAIFRAIEAAKPTLLVDEADLFLAEALDVRACLNSGHKRGGQVIRCVGDDAEPRSFGVHAPAAVAAIGRLPDTLTDRSIRLQMRRATATERPFAIRLATEKAGAVLARKAARWALDHAGSLAEEPAMPDALANRAADNWRILFAISAAAGGKWPDHTRAAALVAEAGEVAESLGVALLRDVRAIFAETGAAELPTAELVRRLVAMDDRPWPELPGTSKPITAAWFTRRVKPYGAERRQWREAGMQVWGFALTGFADAFARYLPDDSPAPPEKSGKVVTIEVRTANFPKAKLVTTEMSPVVSGDKSGCHQFGFPENQAKTKLSPVAPLFSGNGPEESDAGRFDEPWEAEL